MLVTAPVGHRGRPAWLAGCLPPRTAPRRRLRRCKAVAPAFGFLGSFAHVWFAPGCRPPTAPATTA